MTPYFAFKTSGNVGRYEMIRKQSAWRIMTFSPLRHWANRGKRPGYWQRPPQPKGEKNVQTNWATYPPSVVASCTCQEEHKSKPSKTWCHRMPLRSTKLFPACLREVQDTRTPTLQLADTSRAQDPELFLLAMKESYQIQWAEQHWTCRNAIFIHVHTFS